MDCGQVGPYEVMDCSKLVNQAYTMSVSGFVDQLFLHGTFCLVHLLFVAWREESTTCRIVLHMQGYVAKTKSRRGQMLDFVAITWRTHEGWELLQKTMSMWLGHVTSNRKVGNSVAKKGAYQMKEKVHNGFVKEEISVHWLDCDEVMLLSLLHAWHVHTLSAACDEVMFH